MLTRRRKSGERVSPFPGEWLRRDQSQSPQTKSVLGFTSQGARRSTMEDHTVAEGREINYHILLLITRMIYFKI